MMAALKDEVPVLKSTASEHHLQSRITDLLRSMSLFGKIVNYLYKDNGVAPDQNEIRERQHLRTLRDPDTYVMALLVVERYLENGAKMTLGELARAMDKRRTKQMRDKIRDTILPRVGDRFGLFEYSTPDGGKVGVSGYKIGPSQRLLDFFKTVLRPEQ